MDIGKPYLLLLAVKNRMSWAPNFSSTCNYASLLLFIDKNVLNFEADSRRFNIYIYFAVFCICSIVY